MASILDMLKTLDPELQAANIDVAKTFVDRFVKKASA
jgi:NitT/TauT family transport system substrate-binding protein